MLPHALEHLRFNLFYSATVFSQLTKSSLHCMHQMRETGILNLIPSRELVALFNYFLYLYKKVTVMKLFLYF